jgi:hypothetical protein
MYASVISGPKLTFLHLRFLQGDCACSAGATFGETTFIAKRHGVLNVDIGVEVVIDGVSVL